jgi:hypothetical protein
MWYMKLQLEICTGYHCARSCKPKFVMARGKVSLYLVSHTTSPQSFYMGMKVQYHRVNARQVRGQNVLEIVSHAHNECVRGELFTWMYYIN